MATSVICRETLVSPDCHCCSFLPFSFPHFKSYRLTTFEFTDFCELFKRDSQMQQSYKTLSYQSMFTVFLNGSYLQVSYLLSLWSSEGGFTIRSRSHRFFFFFFLNTNEVASLFIWANALFSSNMLSCHDWTSFTIHLTYSCLQPIFTKQPILEMLL